MIIIQSRLAILIGLLTLLLQPGTLLGWQDAIKIIPPNIQDGKVATKLPATVNEVKIGGDGRFILLHMKSLRKIGLFDVNELKIVHYFPANDDDTVFDASATKVFIASGSKGIIARYDLMDRKRELAQTIDASGPINHLLVGSSTEGPVYIGGSAGRYEGAAQVIDEKTLKAVPMKVDGSNRRGFGQGGMVRLSANGKTFGQWAIGVSPSGLQTITKIGDSWVGKYEHDSVGYILPSPNGKRLYTGRGIYTNQLRPVSRPTSQSTFPLPAVHGEYYLTVSGPSRSGRGGTAKESVSLHMSGDNRPLIKIQNLEPVFRDDDRWSRNSLTIEKRLMLIPKANAIVQLNSTADGLIISEFVLKKALEDAGIDYLFVESNPPESTKVDKKFAYQIKALSKQGDVKFKLESGPKGMSISPKGLVSWSPTAKDAPENDIIITVSDKSGQEVFHNFKIKVDGANGASDSNVLIAAAPSTLDGKVKAMGKVDMDSETVNIKLPSTVSNIAHGGGGRYMLLHMESLKKVALFDVEKAKITKYFPASDTETSIAAGLNHLLVFSQSQGVVSRYNLTTHERELTKNLPFTGKFAYATMGSSSMGPVLMQLSTGPGQIVRCRFEFLDLKTLDRKDVQLSGNLQSVNRDQNLIRASGDGKVFAIQGVGVISVNGNSAKFKHNRDSRGTMIPNQDGSYFASLNQVFNRDMKLLGAERQVNYGTELVVPSVTGNYYLHYTGMPATHNRRKELTNVSAKLYMFGDSRPLFTVRDLTPPLVKQQYSALTHDKRVMFVPSANVIVSLSDTNDQLVVRQLDIDKALEESGVDFLVVMSTPPSSAKLGKAYRYKLDVKSKKGGLKFKLESGPDGMKISDKGEVSWNVPASESLAEHKAIVSIKDSLEQEVFHTFSVDIPELEKKVAGEKLKADLAREKLAKEEKARQIAAREEMRRKQKEQYEKLKSDSAKKRTASAQATGNNFQFRQWTDASGQHKFTGKFLRIIDRKTVVLLTEKGKQIKVALTKLSNEDIYEAVKNQLKSNGSLTGSRAEKESPFKVIE